MQDDLKKNLLINITINIINKIKYIILDQKLKNSMMEL